MDNITSFSFTISNNCNLKCSFCPRTRYGVFSKNINPDVLSKLVHISTQVDNVQILGLGEPMCNNNIINTIEKLKNNNVHLSLTSNGTLLTEDICTQLCLLEVDEILISLQGAHKRTHLKGKDSHLSLILKNIESFSLAKKKLGVLRPKISINFVAMTDNITELSSIVSLAYDLNIEQVYVANVVPYDQVTSQLHLHNKPIHAEKHLNLAINKASHLGINLVVYASLSPSPMSCRWLSRPHIGLEGDVYPCNFIGAQDSLRVNQNIWYQNTKIRIDASSFRLGNILEQSLEEIWSSDNLRKLRSIADVSLENDISKRWKPSDYEMLLKGYSDSLLTAFQVCRICPHRFKVTH